MKSDLFSKFGRVTYVAIFDCEWHSLTENVSNTTSFSHQMPAGKFIENLDKIRTLYEAKTKLGPNGAYGIQRENKVK